MSVKTFDEPLLWVTDWACDHCLFALLLNQILVMCILVLVYPHLRVQLAALCFMLATRGSPHSSLLLSFSIFCESIGMYFLWGVYTTLLLLVAFDLWWIFSQFSSSQEVTIVYVFACWFYCLETSVLFNTRYLC